MKKNINKILSIGLLSIIIMFSANLTFAFDSGQLTGYAWSDTIGWISFENVYISKTTGQITGNAWSDAVGWISFDYCHLDAACQGPTYDSNTGKISGTVMVLSGRLNTIDGWDGKIVLSNFTGSPSYGPVLNHNKFTGYSWGSEVVGWFSWNQIKLLPLKNHYIWSDTIGWISFNCNNTYTCGISNYNVDISKTTGQITGNAWSDAVGWISFDYCHLDAACQGPTYDNNTGKISGTVIVLSGLLDAGDGWDGKIVLSDFTGSPAYGPVLNNNINEFTGYSWGSNIVGWISWNCLNDNSCGVANYGIPLDPFEFNFTAAAGTDFNNPLPTDSNILLTWDTIGDVTSCVTSAGTLAWRNHNPGIGQPVPSTFLVNSLNSDTNFTLTCTGLGGTIQRDLYIYVDYSTPTVTFNSADTNISQGTSTNLLWSTENIDSCEISGPNFNPAQSVAVGTNRSLSTGNLTSRINRFEINCIPTNTLRHPHNIIANVKVFTYYPNQLIVDFSVEKNPIPFNRSFRLIWNTENATTCTASSVPSLYGTGGGLATSFNGVPHHSDGRHSFGSVVQTVNNRYEVRLQCSGSSGQSFDETIHLRVRKNPIFIEN